MVAPVTNAPPLDAGKANISRSHRRAMSSSAAAVGDMIRSAAFWSHATASTFAARAIGNAPPLTNPKYRPPAFATVAGEPISSSRFRTAAGSRPSGGRDPPSSSKRPTASSRGATARVRMPSRYAAARDAASRNSVRSVVTSFGMGVRARVCRESFGASCSSRTCPPDRSHPATPQWYSAVVLGFAS